MKKIILLISSLLLIINQAIAATDGDLGATSVGTISVGIQLGDLVRIAGLSDIEMPVSATIQKSATPIKGSTTACIFSSTGQFNMEITSSNSSNSPDKLLLAHTDNQQFIEYHLYIFDYPADDGHAIMTTNLNDISNATHAPFANGVISPAGPFNTYIAEAECRPNAVTNPNFKIEARVIPGAVDTTPYGIEKLLNTGASANTPAILAPGGNYTDVLTITINPI